MELLKNRMMTLNTSAWAGIAFLESYGIQVIDFLTGWTGVAEEVGVVILGAISAITALVQNHLNKDVEKA